jgi:hypothetical protein
MIFGISYWKPINNTFSTCQGAEECGKRGCEILSVSQVVATVNPVDCMSMKHCL